ncbi:MAG: histidine kinase [Acidobacteriota bacterium]
MQRGQHWQQWRQWLPLAAFWTALPLLMSISADLVAGRAPSVPQGLDLVYATLYWWAWIPLTPYITALGRRFPLRGRRALAHIAAHILASWLIAFALNIALALVLFVLPEYSAEIALQQAFRVGHGPGALSQILYWLVLAASVGWGVYQGARQRDALLAEARLQVLKGQVRPHFLFNTLNTVSTLMDEDIPAARQMISHLSELLRASFRGHATQEVTLSEELELTRLYLEIERVRFEDRLRPRLEIDDDTPNALVPHLLLQPLVENAIRHGISRDSTAGDVLLRARRQGDLLCLSIEDDGPGPASGPAGDTARRGVGLANVRGRLQELYGDRARLTLGDRPPRGTKVEIELPFHRQPVQVTP